MVDKTNCSWWIKCVTVEGVDKIIEMKAQALVSKRRSINYGIHNNTCVWLL